MNYTLPKEADPIVVNDANRGVASYGITATPNINIEPIPGWVGITSIVILLAVVTFAIAWLLKNTK